MCEGVYHDFILVKLRVAIQRLPVCSEVRLKKNMKSPIDPGIFSSSEHGGQKSSRCQADSRNCQQKDAEKRAQKERKKML